APRQRIAQQRNRRIRLGQNRDHVVFAAAVLRRMFDHIELAREQLARDGGKRSGEDDRVLHVRVFAMSQPMTKNAPPMKSRRTSSFTSSRNIPIDNPIGSSSIPASMNSRPKSPGIGDARRS